MREKSKRLAVDSMIRRAVREELYEYAFRYPDLAAALRAVNVDGLACAVAYNLTGDPYRMKELADIMAWKRGPRND